MAGEKKSVASLTLLADQPRQELEQLLAAEKRVTEEGGKLATSFANGFQAIEDKAKKALATIANGGNAEQQLNRLIAEYSKLKTAQDAAAASGEKLPEEFVRAFSVAEKQITSVTAAMARQKEQTAELKEHFSELADAEQRVVQVSEQLAEKLATIPATVAGIAASNTVLTDQKEKLDAVLKSLQDEEKALRKLGDVAEPAVGRVRTEMQRVEQELQRVSSAVGTATGRLHDGFVYAKDAEEGLAQAIASGSPRMATAVEKLHATLINLRTEMEAQRKLGVEIPKEQEEEYKRLQAVMDVQVVKVRKLTDEMNEHKQTIKEGGEQWSGLGNAINKALGPMGGVQAKAALIVAALTEGWRIGQQFANAIGTDMGALNAELEEVKQRGAEMQRALVDALSGGEHASIRFRAAQVLSTQAMVGFNRMVEQGLTDEELLKATTDDFNKASELSNRISTAGAASGEILNRVRKEGGKVLADYLVALQTANEVVAIHNKLTLEGADGQAIWNAITRDGQKTLAETKAFLEANIDAITRLIAAEKEEQTAAEDTVKKVREKIAALEDEMRVTKEKIAQDGTELDAEQKLYNLEKQRIDLSLSIEEADKGRTRSIDELVAAIKDHLQYGARYSEQLAGDGALLQGLIAKTDGLTTAERARLTVIAETAAGYGKNEEATAALIAQRNKETDELFLMSAADQKARTEKLASIEALNKQIDATGNATKTQQALTAIQDVQAAATGKAAESFNALSTAATSSKTPMELVRDEMAKIEAGASRVAAADTSAAGAAKHHGDELKTLGDRFKEAGESIKSHLNSELVEVNKQLKDVAENAGKAVEQLRKMAAAADAVGGSHQYASPIGPSRNSLPDGALGRTSSDVAQDATFF